MATRMTSKGQVTIPKTVRKHLGLGPGSRVEFELIADGRVVVAPARKHRRVPAKRTGLTGWDAVRGTLHTGMSTDEIMKMLRGDP